MKIDFRTARMRTHRRNIQRYGRLLATELTDLERQYLHRRIAEEQAELERLARKDIDERSAQVIPNPSQALPERLDQQQPFLCQDREPPRARPADGRRQPTHLRQSKRRVAEDPAEFPECGDAGPEA